MTLTALSEMQRSQHFGLLSKTHQSLPNSSGHPLSKKLYAPICKSLTNMHRDDGDSGVDKLSSLFTLTYTRRMSRNKTLMRIQQSQAYLPFTSAVAILRVTVSTSRSGTPNTWVGISLAHSPTVFLARERTMQRRVVRNGLKDSQYI